MLTDLEYTLLFALAVVCFFYFKAQAKANLVREMVEIIKGVAHKKLRLKIDKETGAIEVERVN